MKKIYIEITFLICLIALPAYAQKFPLAGGLYSYNCNGTVDESTYWLETENGKVIKYGIDLIDRQVSTRKQAVEKFKVINNKLTLQLQNLKDEKKAQYDLLEIFADGKKYRTMERSFGDERFISGGRFIKENIETEPLNRCDPDSSVAIQGVPIFKQLIAIDSPSKARGSIVEKQTKIYTSVKDFPVGEEIETSNFAKSLVAEICKNISGVDNNIAPTVLTMAAPMANSGALAQIYRNGGGRWDGMFISGDACVADFVINGSYNGTSYNARMSCPINKVRRNNPKNTKLDLLWVDSFACRKVG